MSSTSFLVNRVRHGVMQNSQAFLLASRIGVHNRYKWDYACVDEYFEREMTMLESRKLPMPLPETFRHKTLPYNELYPAHMNDVRYNFKP